MSTPIATPPASERGGRSPAQPVTTPGDDPADAAIAVFGVLAFCCTVFMLMLSIYFTLSGTPDESQLYVIYGLDLPIFIIAITALSLAFSKLASVRHPTTNGFILALPIPLVAAIASYGIIITVPDPVIRLHTIFYGLPIYLSLTLMLTFIAVYPSPTPRTEASPLNLMV